MSKYVEFADAEGILTDMFLPGFRSQIEKEKPPLFSVLSAKSDKVAGKNVIFSALMENPQGVGARGSASAVLPTAVAGSAKRVTTGLKRLYAVLEFDDMTLKAAGTAGGRNEFINHTEQEMAGIKTSFLDDKSRQAYGSGNGALSACGVTGASLTLQLSTTAQMQRFVEGMHIDLITTVTGVAIANGSDRTIQSVDVDNKRVVLDTAGGVVTTDSTISAARQGAWGSEVTGLSAIVSATADIYDITTASYRRWKSYVATGVGAFSTKKLAQAMLESKIRGGKFANLIVCSPLRQLQYWYELTGTRTFDVAKSPIPVQKYGTGYYGLEITIEGKKAIMLGDIECLDSEIYGLNTEDIGIQHFGEAEWIKQDGSVLIPNIGGANGTATYKAVMAYYWEIICTRRNSHFKMEGVTDSSGW